MLFLSGNVSDYVTDVVMSSLKTCTMNCGSRWEGRGRVGSKGWAVDNQPGTSVDGHSHHDHKKGDFHVSKKGWFIVQEMGSGQRREQRGELANRAMQWAAKLLRAAAENYVFKMPIL